MGWRKRVAASVVTSAVMCGLGLAGGAMAGGGGDAAEKPQAEAEREPKAVVEVGVSEASPSGRLGEISDGPDVPGVTPTNLRWDGSSVYGRGNSWWPPSYGDSRETWRPPPNRRARSNYVRPYWYDQRRAAWQWGAPYRGGPDAGWPRARYGSYWVPRYGWPGYGQAYPDRGTWNRDRYGYGYGSAAPGWRYGTNAGWSRADGWR